MNTRGIGLIRPALSAVCVTVLMSAGCHQFGPGRIESSRLNYNEIINRTSNEQLLLNLVRLKYRDTPLFLEVSAVTTSFNFSASASAGGNPHDVYPTAAGPGLDYAERPTISYSPVQGSKFATQLLTPMSLDMLALMYHSGWSVERVFLCCVQMMNGVKNAPSASGPTPDYMPTYKDFHAIADIMRDLQKRHDMQFGAVGDKGLALRFAPAVWDTDEGKTLSRLLGIRPGLDVYPLTPNGDDENGVSIGINTRSLLGVLFYLSQSVEAPDDDIVEGRVTSTDGENGLSFDWSECVGKVMRIQSKGSRPLPDTAVRVPYRGTWFFIADDDLNSKSTFSLVAQLFSLQAGEVRAAIPLLTLPGGG
jgi:hypothetical protein